MENFLKLYWIDHGRPLALLRRRLGPAISIVQHVIWWSVAEKEGCCVRVRLLSTGLFGEVSQCLSCVLCK